MRRFDPNARDVLFRWLHSDLSSPEKIDAFRVALEDLYNFQLDRGSLGEAEERALEDLFKLVAYYSPLPRERQAVPLYKDESAVLAAVEKARRIFDVNPPILTREESSLLQSIVAERRPDLLGLVGLVGRQLLSAEERLALINMVANKQLDLEVRPAGARQPERLEGLFRRLKAILGGDPYDSGSGRRFQY
jgi:hypothetical protein